MKALSRFLALIWLLIAGSAWGGQAVTTLEEVVQAANPNPQYNLCGYYQEGGKVLQIKQSGNQIKGYISQGSTRCLSEPQLYFQGTLTGYKFSGKMTVCNPQVCVDAGKMAPTRETEFRFVVYEKGKRLLGTWVYDRIEYDEKDGQIVSCRDVAQEERSDFMATRGEGDCDSLRRALINRRKMQAMYADYQVTGTGAVVRPDGREVARDFNSFQSLLEDMAKRPQAGNSGVDGGVNPWDFADVMAGRSKGHASPCWCETRCSKNQAVDCQESWAEDECRAHESSHCQTLVDFCEQYLLGKPRAQAWAAWQSFLGDTSLHMADEQRAYQASIDFLEQKLEEGGCP